jgi:phage virion morphogenesis protein
MAGVTIEIDDAEIKAALQRLEAAIGDLKPAFRDIGEHLLISHDQRFRQQVDPNGNPWADTSVVTKARKTKNKNKILIESGDLMTTLRYQVSTNSLEFGTDRVYGSMMQFGGTKAQFPHLWGDIPARPFLGLSNDDKNSILDILRQHLLSA